MAIEARNRPLLDWFTRIRTRQLVLPRFQRFEAWDHSNVTQLLNTVLQGLPTGAVLVLEIGDKEPFISRSLVGAPTEGEKISEHLLDGQQRLTALWRGLRDNYSDRSYFLQINEKDETVAVHSEGRWMHDEHSRRPLWADKPQEQLQRSLIPLKLCSPETEASEILEWCNLAASDQAASMSVFTKIIKAQAIFRAFNLPFLSLPATTDPDTALDVFLKMNTSAAPLRLYDIVVAQVEAGMGQSLHDMVAEIRENFPLISSYTNAGDLALSAGALLQSRSPTNSSYSARDFGPELIKNWPRFMIGIRRTLVFLEEERIFDERRLPTDVVLPALVALWADAPNGGDAEGRARSIIRKYFWRSCFTNRYERSTSTRVLSDYQSLQGLIGGNLGIQPEIFDTKVHPLPHPEELLSAGWPTKKDRLARAILALSLREGGLDLADGSMAARSNLSKREYHHLFPIAHLALQSEVKSTEVWRALNCALITWKTNRNIGPKPPVKYIEERFGHDNVSSQEIERRLESHIIPLDQLKAGVYSDFLNERAKRVHEILCSLAQFDPVEDSDQI